MPYTLACRDAGVDCNFVAKGETKEQALAESYKARKESAWLHG